MKCGLCYTDNQPLSCPSCVNASLLPLRIKYLDTLQQYDTSKRLIDIILKDHCVHGANYDFIRSVKDGEVKWGELNVGGMSVGVGSVVALASQLLTLDSRLCGKDINRLKKCIDGLKTDIENSKVKEQEAREEVKKFREGMKREYDEVEEVEFKDAINDNNQILKQLQQSRSLLFHELIRIYVIKKKKLLNSSNSIIMMSFTPVISIPQILDLNRDTINFSFQIMAKFLTQLATILDFTLPYTISYKDATLKTQPEILKFQLYITPEINKVLEMPNFELKLLLSGIARLSFNVFKILQRLDLDSGITQYTQLFKMDEMIYKLAHPDYAIAVVAPLNDGSSSPSQQVNNKLKNDQILIVNGEKKVDVEVLNAKLYRFVMGKINQKSTEWHVVKEGSFEDIG